MKIVNCRRVAIHCSVTLFSFYRVTIIILWLFYAMIILITCVLRYLYLLQLLLFQLRKKKWSDRSNQLQLFSRDNVSPSTNYALFREIPPQTRRRSEAEIDPSILRGVTEIRTCARALIDPACIRGPHSGSIIEISIPVIDEPDRSRDVSQVTGGITNVCAETSSMYLSFVSVHAISKW